MNQRKAHLPLLLHLVPATDFQTEFLFRQAIKGKRVKILVVVGRDTSKLVPSFENVFGNLVDGPDQTFLEYAQRSFEPEVLSRNHACDR